MEIKEGYKKTELGVIPVNWEVKKLKEIFKITAGRDVMKDKYSPIFDNEHSFPIYSNSLENSGLYGYTKYARHKKNSITITGRGGLGKANAREEDFDAIGRLLVMEPKTDLDCVFIAEYINHSVKFFIESTGVPQLTVPQASNYCIAFPPLPEQHKITSIISNIDGLTSSLKKLIKKKKNIKQGTLQKLLKPKSGWTEKVLGETVVLKARIGWQGLTTAEYKEAGDYILITGTDFKNGFIDWSNCCYVDKFRYDQDKNIQIKVEDVLVTKDGTIGKVAFVHSLPKPATLNSGVFVIRPIQKLFHPYFFYYILLSKTFDEFLTKLSAGSTITHLYQKDFVNFKFLIPPTLEEQINISNVLSSMDNEIQALEEKLGKYEDIKQGMMQELLNGKIRLVGEV